MEDDTIADDTALSNIKYKLIGGYGLPLIICSSWNLPNCHMHEQLTFFHHDNSQINYKSEVSLLKAHLMNPVHTVLIIKLAAHLPLPPHTNTEDSY